MKTIPMKDFKEKLAKGPIQIIDLRPADQFEKKHLDNSINLEVVNINEEIEGIDKTKEVYVICGSGMRSLNAVTLLAEQGFDAISVEGGMMTFKDN